MDSINELELRRCLKEKKPSHELIQDILKKISDPSLAWEEKRPFFYYLFLTERRSTLALVLADSLKEKEKVPLELVIELFALLREEPKPQALDALFKGLKKQEQLEGILAARGFDKWDPRLKELRDELLAKKLSEQKKAKENLIEKFWFLRGERMNEQAGRALRRLLELYPEEAELVKLKAEFDEEWARDVLSNHASRHSTRMERTLTAPSSKDEEMLSSFLEEGIKLVVENRELASDLALAFMFMEDYGRALEALAYAEPSLSAEWLKCELLVRARRFIEALELLNQIEVKYTSDPETTFAVSYLRAQALHGLGQESSATEILQSILRVRPGYRSAHSLILQWSEGAGWE